MHNLKLNFDKIMSITKLCLREEVNKRLSSYLKEGEYVWIVDSMPISICKNGRDNS